MDSDEEFETGLPKISHDEGFLAGKINLNDLIEGNSHEMTFDVPEEVETEGFKTKSQRVHTPSAVLNRATSEQLNLKFMAPGADERLKVMFGDYSEIETLMENITEDCGLKKRILKPGTGKKVAAKNMVLIHYLLGAELLDDLFESTYEHRRPRRFRVGNGEVLPAIDIGVVGMRVGEVSKFLATCQYGFGPLGVPAVSGGGIPADSRIMIQIELVETYVSEKDVAVVSMSSAERRELPFETVLASVEEMKKEGNREFQYENYDLAIKSYCAALDVIQDLDPIMPNEKADYFKLKHQICNNLANVYFKTGKFHRTLKYAEEGVDIPVNGVLKAKSHYWCAKSLYSLGRYELCYDHIKKADSMRSDTDIKKFRVMVDKKMDEIKEREKQLCSKMMMMGV